MITLPDPPRRHWVGPFWWVASVLVTALLVLVFVLLPLPVGPLAGLALAAVVVVPGFILPDLQVRAYQLWNRVARKVSVLAAGWTTRLLFGVVWITGGAGSRFLLGAPTKGASAWSKKHTGAPADYQSQSDGPGRNDISWWKGYQRWTSRSGRLWMLPLLPLLALLGAVETRERGSFGGNVYTLY